MSTAAPAFATALNEWRILAITQTICLYRGEHDETLEEEAPNVKANLVLGPWLETEFFGNFGAGFHVTYWVLEPLQRTRVCR